jgi:hypothetical protein
MARLQDNYGALAPEELEIAVAMGQVPGWSTLSVWNEQTSIGTSLQEMSNVSGIRTLPTTGGEITVASTSAEDGAGTATGALSLFIEYLDSSFNKLSTTVTLNGTSNVVSSGLDAFRLRYAKVISAGSTGAAVGNITISMDSNAQAVILATHNESRESGTTFQAGHKFLTTGAVLDVGRSGTVEVDYVVEFRLAGTNIWYTLRSLEVYQQTVFFDALGAAVLPAGTDFRILAKASGGSGTGGYVQIRGWEISNNYFTE